MVIISGDYLLLCDESFTIIKDGAIAFDTKIKEIGVLKELIKKYPHAKVTLCAKNSVLMPGLINPHLHLEFSSNQTTLKYGDFIGWLNSVITHRDELSFKSDENCIDSVLKEMLHHGTTTLGAISSFGADLSSCIKTAQNVIYFNEVLGSNPATVDALYGDFLGRLKESEEHKSNSFIPAISIHSPYSTHPILAKKVLEIAKDEDMLVSTHFMESKAEREWLESGKGDFKGFFESFAPNSKPVNDPISYLKLFLKNRTLFTHACYAYEEEFEIMNSIGTITHCPVSNRLLSSKKIDIQKIKNLTLATDGLSSNSSLNLWDEMRSALMMHQEIEVNELAKQLLIACTLNGAKALGRNSGCLTEGKDADIISIVLPQSLEHNLEDIALFLILHAKVAEHIFIAGKEQL